MNLRQSALKFFLRVFAAELVRQAYRGLLAREVDPPGITAYEAKLGQSNDLEWLLRSLGSSDEHWAKMLEARAQEVIHAVFQGLLNREPEPKALATYAAKLTETHNLSSLLGEVALSSEHWRRAMSARAPELVRTIYLGLLSREPEPEALRVLSSNLAETCDLVPMLAGIARSDELWKRMFHAHAAELVRALYQGTLSREPGPEALDILVGDIVDTGDVTPLLAGIARSDELWRQMFDARAPEMIQAIVQALLNRELGPEDSKHYLALLSETHDLTSVLAAVARSDGHWEHLFAERAPRFVESIYRNLLQREADPSGLTAYSTEMGKPNGFDRVLSKIIGSAEFIKLQQKSALVFLHIQKTAGTSIQGMLRDAFGKDAYTEHDDSLDSHTPKELSAFSVYAGHFNHDSLCHIPWRRLSIFTFVREPKDRLVSLYHFWRAHEPTASNWSGGTRIANELLIEEFFSREEFTKDSGIWNHMAWAIMGHDKWNDWRSSLVDATKEVTSEFIASEVRPAIRQRLRGFAFVGLQEEYDRSVAMLYKILKMPIFKRVRADHRLEDLLKDDPNFKKHITRQPRTERLDRLLERFVELDDVVYAEAKELYDEKVAEFGQGTRSGSGAVSLSGSTTFSTLDLTQEKLVFLHIPRTGGETLHSLLLPHFSSKQICPERLNGLRHYVCGELARYRYFSGHFDLPSVNLIPGRKKIITLLREPVERLVSLYNVLRAHRVDVIERQNLELARLANQYSMLEFFRADAVRTHYEVNNAMIRALTQTTAGERWSAQADHHEIVSDPMASVTSALEELKAFETFGIMEQYDDSVRVIFSAIGFEIPENIEKRQVLDIIVEREPGLKKINKEPITNEIREVIGSLVEADTQLYQQAKRLFETRLEAIGRPPGDGRILRN